MKSQVTLEKKLSKERNKNCVCAKLVFSEGFSVYNDADFNMQDICIR